MPYFKLLYLTFAIFVCSFSSACANHPYGFWQTVDAQTHLPTSVIAVYPYQGKIYGKIIASFDSRGNLEETIYQPCNRAPGLQGYPFYCGLDIIWASPASGKEPAKGQLIDPRSGKTYTAKLWVERGNLVLRGELMMFGKNEVLLPFPDHNFNSGFQKPDLYQLIPASFH